MNELRVSSRSDPGATAGAIANGIRELGEADMVAVGPRAVNQSVKAIAIARSYVAAAGVDLYFVPGFTCVHMPEEEEGRTGMHFAIRSRHATIGGSTSRQTRTSTTEGS